MATLCTESGQGWGGERKAKLPERGVLHVVLALGPAGTFAGFLKSRLLAFHLARIAGEEACLLQFLAEIGVEEFQRAGDAMADSISLPRDTAPVDLRGDFEALERLETAQWLFDAQDEVLIQKVVGIILVVDRHERCIFGELVSGFSGHQTDARDGGLTASDGFEVFLFCAFGKLFELHRTKLNVIFVANGVHEGGSGGLDFDFRLDCCCFGCHSLLNFEVTQQNIPLAVLRKHTAHCHTQDFFLVFRPPLFQGALFHTARVQ